MQQCRLLYTSSGLLSETELCGQLLRSHEVNTILSMAPPHLVLNIIWQEDLNHLGLSQFSFVSEKLWRSLLVGFSHAYPFQKMVQSRPHNECCYLGRYFKRSGENMIKRYIFENYTFFHVWTWSMCLDTKISDTRNIPKRMFKPTFQEHFEVLVCFYWEPQRVYKRVV